MAPHDDDTYDGYGDLVDPRAQYKALLAAVTRLEQKGKRNGDSWPLWLVKVVATPERIMLIALLVVQTVWWLGGEVRGLQFEVQQFKATKEEVAEAVAAAKSVNAEARALNADYRRHVDDLMQQTDVLAKTSRALDDRVSRTATRAELNAAVNLQLVPRMVSLEQSVERINKKVSSAAVFSGEQPQP